MRGRVVRYYTNTWGLSLIFEEDKDELSAEGTCGGVALYNSRVPLTGDDREAVVQSHMNFDLLDRKICRDQSFQAHLQSPIQHTEVAKTLDEFIAAINAVKRTVP